MKKKKDELKVTIVSADGTEMSIEEFVSEPRSIDCSNPVNRRAIENYIRLSNIKHDQREITKKRKEELNKKIEEINKTINKK